MMGEKTKNQKRILFLDMERVLSDLDGYFMRRSGVPVGPLLRDESLITATVQKLTLEQEETRVRVLQEAGKNKNMWQDLDIIPGAKSFYTTIKKYFDDVYILSSYRFFDAPSRSIEDVQAQKWAWMQAHIDANISKEKIIVTDKAKKDYLVAEAECFLVDADISSRWVIEGARLGILAQGVYVYSKTSVDGTRVDYERALVDLVARGVDIPENAKVEREVLQRQGETFCVAVKRQNPRIMSHKTR